MKTKGEIASSLALLSLFFVLGGVFLGSSIQSIVEKRLTTSSRASEECYKSTGSILFDQKTTEDLQFGINTVVYGVTTFGNKVQVSRGSDLGTFDNNYNLPDNQKGKLAEYSLQLPTGYSITNGYCKDIEGNACVAATWVGNTIKNVALNCGSHVDYGWSVKKTTSTPPGSCTYKTRVRIYENQINDASLIKFDATFGDSWKAVNNKQMELKFKTAAGDIADKLLDYPNANFSGGTQYSRGETASVRLRGPNDDQWDVKQVYCKNNSSTINGCPKNIDSQNQSPQRLIDGFTVDCGVDIEYGWVLKKLNTTPPNTPTPPKDPKNPTPTNAPTTGPTTPTAKPTKIPTTPTATPGTCSCQKINQPNLSEGVCTPGCATFKTNGNSCEKTTDCTVKKTPTTPTQGPTNTPVPPVLKNKRRFPAGAYGQRKILHIIYDPFLKSKGQTLLEYKKDSYGDPKLIAETAMDALSRINGISYKIVRHITLHSFPAITPNDQTPDELERGVLDCLSHVEDSRCIHLKRGRAMDYAKINSELKLCERVNKGEFDEIFISTYPYTPIGETDMFGPNPFNANGWHTTIPECNKNVMVMSLNYERDFKGIEAGTSTYANTMHVFGHRAEATIAYALGQRNPNDIIDNPRGAIEYFSQRPATTFNPKGCGIIHFPFNEDREYHYDNENTVKSMCDTFRKDYPNIKLDAKPLNCQIWGCTEIGYYDYWFDHIPHKSGRDSNGMRNDWWAYINDYQLAAKESKTSRANSFDLNGDNKVTALDLALLMNTYGDDRADKSGSINALDLSNAISVLDYNANIITPTPHDHYEKLPAN